MNAKSNVKEVMKKKLQPILAELRNFSNDIEAASVMSRDGINIASAMDDTVDSDRLGAMCASLLSLSDKTAAELQRGKLKQVLIEGEQGCILMVQIGERAVLAVVSKPTSNLGMVFLEAKKTVKTIIDSKLI